jgi:nucleoside-diphosphate-sugar epimerase
MRWPGQQVEELGMSNIPNHVLVTGADGLLGREVVAYMRGIGVRVTAMLHKPGDLPADRVVVGSTDDVPFVRDALDGVDAIIHCAAIPAPMLGTAEAVFCGNTTGTFTVLEQGGQAGVRRAVIASSYSVLGLTFAPGVRHPAYLPIDELTPVQIEDPYALSKQVDELVAELMWWRHGLSVVALRLPFLGGISGRLPERAARISRDPSFGTAAREFWAYLETRDAARACALGLSESPPGCHVVSVAAPKTLAPYPTEQLLAFYHPDVPRRSAFPGRTAPFDLSRAGEVLHFSAEYIWETEERDFDPGKIAAQAVG